MPNCLCVEKKLFNIRTIHSVAGSLVPWEVKGYFKDFEMSNHPWGFFDLSHWESVAMAGKDSSDFLHRMSTCNLNKLEKTQLNYLAFLTGKANPIAFGQILKLDDENFVLQFPAGQGTLALDHIEKFHFAEDFQSRLILDQGLTALWIPQGIQSSFSLLALSQKPFESFSAVVEGIPVTYWRDDVRPELFWVTMKRDALEDFWMVCRREGGNLLGLRLFEFFRILAGVPQVGQELSEKEIFLEANFEQGVARNKGCYPGQEVIERIFTYGQVNKKLLPVTLSTVTVFPTPPFFLQSESGPAASVVSLAEFPENPAKATGLAYVGKAHWDFSGQLQGPQGITAVLGRGI